MQYLRLRWISTGLFGNGNGKIILRGHVQCDIFAFSKKNFMSGATFLKRFLEHMKSFKRLGCNKRNCLAGCFRRARASSRSRRQTDKCKSTCNVLHSQARENTFTSVKKQRWYKGLIKRYTAVGIGLSNKCILSKSFFLRSTSLGVAAHFCCEILIFIRGKWKFSHTMAFGLRRILGDWP